MESELAPNKLPIPFVSHSPEMDFQLVLAKWKIPRKEKFQDEIVVLSIVNNIQRDAPIVRLKIEDSKLVL